MRDFIILVAICLLVALVAAWFLYPAQVFALLSRADAALRLFEPQQKPQTQSKTTAATRMRNLAPRAPVRKQPAQTSEPLPVFRMSAPVEPPGRESPRGPDPDQVKIGSNGTEVLTSFGPPAVSVSTEDRGHLDQTYVYGGEGQSSVIHLSDRKVSSVQH